MLHEFPTNRLVAHQICKIQYTRTVFTDRSKLVCPLASLISMFVLSSTQSASEFRQGPVFTFSFCQPGLPIRHRIDPPSTQSTSPPIYSLAPPILDLAMQHHCSFVFTAMSSVHSCDRRSPGPVGTFLSVEYDSKA